jgi:hypothetical protein
LIRQTSATFLSSHKVFALLERTPNSGGSNTAERDIDQCIQQAEAASEGRENLAETTALAPQAAL